MKYLIELLEKLGITFIAIDKQAHFIVGFVIAMFTFLVSGQLLAGIFMAGFFGYAKVFYDGSRFDMQDFYYTLGGGIFFALIALIWQ